MSLIVSTLSGYPLLSAEREDIEDAQQQEAALLTKWQRIMGINYEIVVGQLPLPNFLTCELYLSRKFLTIIKMTIVKSLREVANAQGFFQVLEKQQTPRAFFRDLNVLIQIFKKFKLESHQGAEVNEMGVLELIIHQYFLQQYILYRYQEGFF